MHDRPISSLAIADTRLSVLDGRTPTEPPDPGATTLFMQSSVALQAGQFEVAEALLRDALQLAPHLAEAHANLAWLLDRRDLPEDALQHYAWGRETRFLNRPLVFISKFLCALASFASTICQTGVKHEQRNPVSVHQP